MILGIYAFFFIVMLITLKTKYHVYTKTLTSLVFLSIAIYGATQSRHMTYLYAMLPGLIGCVVGDYLLATHYQKSFLYGLIAFLIDNTCYV
ncbi:MAG: lysoplasmalogenase family protein, partial [Coprobacillus sp.]